MIVNELLATLESQRSFLKDLDLPSDQLNFVPNGSKNSIGILLEHITGAEKSLIQQMVFGIEINRDREKEFESKTRSLEELKKEYLASAEITKSLLSTKLEDDQLFDERERRGNQKTVFWAIVHAIEHNNYHIGQIYLLLALLKQ